MRAMVDRELCTGCGLCEEICPDLLRRDGSLAIVFVNPIPQAAEKRARKAAAQCPSKALCIVN